MQGTDCKLETLCEGKMQPAAGIAVPVDSGEGYKSKTCLRLRYSFECFVKL